MFFVHPYSYIYTRSNLYNVMYFITINLKSNVSLLENIFRLKFWFCNIYLWLIFDFVTSISTYLRLKIRVVLIFVNIWNLFVFSKWVKGVTWRFLEDFTIPKLFPQYHNISKNDHIFRSFTPYTLLEIVSGIKKLTIPSGIKND